MSFDLVEIWNHMGILAKLIAGVLVLFAIASIGVVVERTLAFAKGAKESREFAKQVAPKIERWEIEDVATIAEKHAASPLARVFGHTVDRYLVTRTLAVVGHRHLRHGSEPATAIR